MSRALGKTARRPSWVAQIKFLCFDLDGTLYQSVPAVWHAIQDQAVDEAVAHTHWTLEKTRLYLRERFAELGSTTKVLNELGIDGETFFTRVFEEIDLSQYVKPDRSLRRLMENLKHRYQLGLLSHNGRIAVEKKMAAIGLPLRWFDPVISAFDIRVLKPDPVAFLTTLERAGKAPAESVYIGDKEVTDVLGAHNVGMRAILVWGESREADLSLPTIYDLGKVFL